MDDNTLARVEQQRSELEQNIASLRKSLRYWQTLEIDYEGLKEEFQGLPDDTPSEECLQAAKDFKPELVDEKELESLFEINKTRRKKPSDLVEIFSKRVDYVIKNISTIRKQLSTAEKKRNALLLVEDPDHQEDAGLPLSEITEEIDEQGKVISSKVQAPGQDTSGLLDVLRKAGVTDLADGTRPDGKNAKVEEDEDADDADMPAQPTNVQSIKPSAGQTLSSSASRVMDLSDSDEDSATDVRLGPVNPNDNEEDAAMRQEMLRYGLGEVGAIVAELDLEESADHSYNDDDDDDYLSDYDEDEDLYTDESEDEKGATKNPVISERYKRQMEALSKKHGITGLKNIGPEAEPSHETEDKLDRPPPAEAARKAALARAEASKSALKAPTNPDNETDEPQKKKKKSVAFASSLDIAQEETQPKSLSDTPSAPTINPVGGTILERTPGQIPTMTLPPASPQPPNNPPKISRFKATRSSTPQTPLFPPPQTTFPSPSSTSQANPPTQALVSPDLIERPQTHASTSPTEPDDLDPELHRHEVATEYQRLRNRRIHEQGGYVRGGPDENYGEAQSPANDVVVDGQTGKERKVSRFKAARFGNA